jgi:hypothetical protein
MAKKKENDGWVLSPGGRHIIKSEKTEVYYLKKVGDGLFIDILSKTDRILI